jgi:hypothetical protein
MHVGRGLVHITLSIGVDNGKQHWCTQFAYTAIFQYIEVAIACKFIVDAGCLSENRATG